MTFIVCWFPLKTARLELEILNGQATYAKIRVARQIDAGKNVYGLLFYAHGLPYKDPRLHAKPTDYDRKNQNIYNFKEYAKVNQYFYKLFTFHQPHYK